MASTMCAALHSAGIPEDEWLSELRGLQRDNQLEHFVAAMREDGAGSAAPPPPDDDFVEVEGTSVGDFVSWTKFDDDIPKGSVGQVVLVKENGRRRIRFLSGREFNIKQEELKLVDDPVSDDIADPAMLASSTPLAAFAHIEPYSKKECLYRCARKAALFPSVSRANVRSSLRCAARRITH